MTPGDPDIKDEEIQQFLEIVRSHSNYDFTNYSMKSLKRRLTKLLLDKNYSMVELSREIKNDRPTMEAVVKNITVNTTELFRDPAIWRNIRYHVLPEFVNRDNIRIWHAGCSTGQEVYSMMIILAEEGLLDKSEIYASDINTDVLETAREGKYRFRFNQIYLENFDAVINTGPDAELLPKKTEYSKYFLLNNVSDIIQMKEFLTQKPYYKKIDLVRDENLFNINFDIIVCRNVIIYFNYGLQNKVINLFYQNINAGGYLVLGLHESILGPYSLYFDKKHQVYLRKNIVR